MAILKKAQSKATGKAKAKKATTPRPARFSKADRVDTVIGEIKTLMSSGIGSEKRASISGKLDEISTIVKGR